jgi:urease accessory protein
MSTTTTSTTISKKRVQSGKENSAGAQGAQLAYLRLLQLADSALPIGALAHSFGLETLVAGGRLVPHDLPKFLAVYLEEAGTLEAVFCREGFRLAAPEEFSGERWVEINERLSALKGARESRGASAALGQHFMAAIVDLGEFAVAGKAAEAAARAHCVMHHGPAFGLAGAALGVDEETVVLAYLHQSMAGMVSACQRLLPLGQRQATRILWELKPAMMAAVRRSRECAPEDACCFLPLLEWGAMEHPALATRLFIS